MFLKSKVSKILALSILICNTSWAKDFYPKYEKNIDMMKGKAPEELSNFDWSFYAMEMDEDIKQEIESYHNLPEENTQTKKDQLSDIRSKIVKKYVDKKFVKPSVKKVRESSSETKYLAEQVDKITGQSQVEASMSNSFKIGSKADIINGEAKIWMDNKVIDSRIKVAYEDSHPCVSVKKPIDLSQVTFSPFGLLDYEFGYYLDENAMYSNVSTSVFTILNLSIESVHDTSKESTFSLSYETKF